MWLPLKKKTESLFDPSLRLQVQCAVYPPNSLHGKNGVPRFWLTLGRADERKVLFDYLHDFTFLWDLRCTWPRPYENHVSDLCGVLIRYVNAPKAALFSLRDRWGLSELLRAGDRRIGRRRWAKMYATGSPAVRRILEARGFEAPDEEAFRNAEAQRIALKLRASEASLPKLKEGAGAVPAQDLKRPMTDFLRAEELLALHVALGFSASKQESERAALLCERVRLVMLHDQRLDWRQPILKAALMAKALLQVRPFSEGAEETALAASVMLLERFGRSVPLRAIGALRQLLAELPARESFEETASRFEEVRNAEAADEETADPAYRTLRDFPSLRFRPVRDAVLDAAERFVDSLDSDDSEEAPCRTLWIVSETKGSNNAGLADVLRDAVSEKLLARHPGWIRESLGSAALLNGESTNLSVRSCRPLPASDVIRARVEKPDLLEINDLNAFLWLGEENLRTVLGFFAEREAAHKPTIILEDILPEEFFTDARIESPGAFSHCAECCLREL